MRCHMEDRSMRSKRHYELGTFPIKGMTSVKPNTLREQSRKPLRSPRGTSGHSPADQWLDSRSARDAVNQKQADDHKCKSSSRAQCEKEDGERSHKNNLPFQLTAATHLSKIRRQTELLLPGFQRLSTELSTIVTGRGAVLRRVHTLERVPHRCLSEVPLL